MSYKYLIFAFLLLVNNLINGQSLPEVVPVYSFHSIGISSGINQEKEENLLPLVHSGFVLNISYGYRYIEKNFQDVQFILGFSRIISNPEDVTKSVNFLVNFSYSYSFKIIDKSELKLYLGPQAGASYSLSIFPNWDESHGYWADYFSLGPIATVQYYLSNNKKIHLSLSLPAITLFSRPDQLRLYKYDETSAGEIFNNLHSNMKWGLWNSVFALHLNFEYQFPIFQTKLEAISYSVDYARIKNDDGNPFQQLIQQIGLKLML